MSVADADPLLRRLERRAMAFCGLAAAGALAVQRGRPAVALGVLGGGVLVAVSYWTIRSSIDGLLGVVLPPASSPPVTQDGEGGSEPRAAEAPADGAERAPAAGRAAARRRAIGYGLRFVGRYAMLGGLAYVMLVWLGLHPVGLMLGVSSIAVAAAMEAASSLARPRPR